MKKLVLAEKFSAVANSKYQAKQKKPNWMALRPRREPASDYTVHRQSLTSYTLYLLTYQTQLLRVSQYQWT